MFSFFFEKLYCIQEINTAFYKICLEKMLSDGYIDMSVYIYGRIKKDSMRCRLKEEGSEYATLFDGPYPLKDTAYNVWNQKIRNLHNSKNEVDSLTYTECVAIVYWVYQVMKNAGEKEEFTNELFARLKELYSIKHHITLSRGLFYNEEKVEIHFLSSLSEINSFLSHVNQTQNPLFFRGHADPNYLLRPSVMRSIILEKSESKMYHDIIIECPKNFEMTFSHLEKLVEMQHYGLPTRLLDITRNPLVALYFACESNIESNGELILISAKDEDIKYPQSDVVTILSSLPLFERDMQNEFCDLAMDKSINDEDFNCKIDRLIHEVRLEKPAFKPQIKKEDLLNNYIVLAKKNNDRIVKQDGAFILCGLRNPYYSLEKYRYMEHGKKVVLIIQNKERILKQLEAFCINHATLFPEIECVADYIKGKYSKLS